jgi:ankyrin repeat protein
MSGNGRSGDHKQRLPLHYAAASGDLVGVLAALGSGGDVNVPDSLGWTALHFAAQSQCAAVAAELLAHGAVVDAQDAQGNTPLWRAVFTYRGDPGLLLVLREHRADPDQANAHGVSPRQLATKIANYDVATHVTW